MRQFVLTIAAVFGALAFLQASPADALTKRTDELMWMCEGRAGDNDAQNLLEMTSTRERLGALVAYLKHANERLEKQIHQKHIVETARGNGDLGKPGAE